MRPQTTTARTDLPPLDAYDLIVFGAGAVGENVADRAVQGGLSVLIVEGELVGGECSYWACMPSKALLRAGSVLRAAHAVPGARAAVSGGLDASAVLASRDAVASNWDDAGQVRWLQKAGIALARGHARVSGERRVTITAADGTVRTVTAEHAVAICTGSTAALPPIDGLAEANPWTSREITSTETVPARLAIIGGGVVGCEMATAFTSLGSAVTLLARSGLLAGVEPFAGEAVAERLRADGAEVMLETSPERVDRRVDGTVALTLPGGRVLEVDELVVATGRAPGTGDLGLEAIGLEPGSGLEVDDTLRVRGFDWLYAVGDVNTRALLTHQGKYQARAAGDVIVARASGASVDDAPWGAHVATADHDAVPQVTFTSPEVASVGLTAAQAEQRGLRTRVVDYELGWLAGATVHGDDYRGTARMIVDEDRGVIIGFTLVGDDVGELLHAATIAIVGEVPLHRLWHAVPSYPTLSEIWLRLLEGYGRP
ncbi:dihydrolipoyl dehydrogenase family protein [Microcella sp.]|uniref:dihydrolipoyl dehydrogenase family protein n=1 Tax=Microcella sp. TaxID=1913979 RepID=UPI003F708836